jgi:TolB-like protein/Tfp pilus assembly protein PilF
MRLFSELKRRNVFRVSIAYLIVAWLLMQVADVMIENIGAPDWVFKTLLLALAIGFVVVVIFSWVFELTPEGIKRDSEVDRSQSITQQTGRKLDRAIIIVLVLAVAYFIWESRYADHDHDRTSEEMGSEPFSQEAAGQTASAGNEKRALTPEESEPSIAVLPFTDMSPEGDQAYFSDGISEELLNLLVRVKGLAVASRTSSFAFKGTQLGLEEIAEELGVDHVLEGSVRKAGDQVRITAQLIDARTDRHLWSDTFDRKLDDIFAIQDEIANAIVQALQNELGLLQDAGEITVEADTGNLDAYELYLQGRQLFIARDQLPRSMELLEQAVGLDPAFARAWETLAAVYSVAPSWNIQDREYVRLSNEAAERALALNDRLSMAWAVLGSNAANEAQDFINGIDYLDKSLVNDPRNTTALLWRSIFYSTLGFLDQAIADGRACLELDPQYQNCRRHLAIHHLARGDKDIAMNLYLQGVRAGFKGSSANFTYQLARDGNDMAAALALWDMREDITYPAELILDAMAEPGADQRDRRERFLRWAQTKDRPLRSWTNELLVVQGFDLLEPFDFGNHWIWLPQSAKFRTTPYFKDMLREHGWLDYWRQKSFPPQCQPVGEDDFECRH